MAVLNLRVVRGSVGMVAIALAAGMAAAAQAQRVPAAVIIGTRTFEPERADAAARVAELVKALESDDPVARRDAARALASEGGLRLRHLEPHLRSAALTPEQRERLMAAAWQRFRDEPRGRLGIRFREANEDSRSPTVQFVDPAFPAAPLLRENDRFDAIDGVRIERQQQLRSAIIAGDPGGTVALDLTRDGRPIRVVAPLGEIPPREQAGSEWLLSLAWAHRSRGYAASSPAPIASGLTPESWQLAYDPEPTLLLRRRAQRDAVSEMFEVAMGGEPRAQSTMPLGAMREPMDQVSQLVLQMDDHRRIIAYIEDENDRLRAESIDPTLDFQTRAMLESTIQRNANAIEARKRALAEAERTLMQIQMGRPPQPARPVIVPAR